MMALGSGADGAAERDNQDPVHVPWYGAWRAIRVQRVARIDPWRPSNNVKLGTST
jgi:hypothetical protein